MTVVESELPTELPARTPNEAALPMSTGSIARVLLSAAFALPGVPVTAPIARAATTVAFSTVRPKARVRRRESGRRRGRPASTVVVVVVVVVVVSVVWSSASRTGFDMRHNSSLISCCVRRPVRSVTCELS